MSLSKFFNSKPVDRQIFVQICEKLGLEWEEVVAKPFRQPEPEDNKQNKDYNNRKEGEATARKFIHNLKRNQQMRELSVTPILLNLTCLVFREKGEFTSKRSKLYEEGLNRIK